MIHETTDETILRQIERLVAEERELRDRDEPEPADTTRLERLQVALDQCWDLLQQRRALRDAGQNPDRAEVRPAEVVESYQRG
jgi:hypothetical protein